MSELHPSSAKALVREAEITMFKRYVEIADSPDGDDERVQIQNALDDLWAVAVHISNQKTLLSLLRALRQKPKRWLALPSDAALRSRAMK